jgi:hypothetical protein
MSKFIIADVTDAKSVVQELQAIVPDYPSVPVRLIIIKSQEEPGMFDHLRQFRSVVTGAFKYENNEEVVESINERILEPVEAKLKELSPSEAFLCAKQAWAHFSRSFPSLFLGRTFTAAKEYACGWLWNTRHMDPFWNSDKRLSVRSRLGVALLGFSVFYHLLLRQCPSNSFEDSYYWYHWVCNVSFHFYKT